jgi:hypothetical protein
MLEGSTEILTGFGFQGEIDFTQFICPLHELADLFV